MVASHGTNTLGGATMKAEGQHAQDIQGVKDSAGLAFRRALGQFPTGVAVITGLSAEDHRPVGITVSSFNSVSLDPPLVLWSLARSSRHLSSFVVGRPHVIHVLTRGQEALALRFASTEIDKFCGIDLESKRLELESGTRELPSLLGWTARFSCVTDTVYPGGDHCIIVARVDSHEVGSGTPLVFVRGRFAGLDSEAGKAE